MRWSPRRCRRWRSSPAIGYRFCGAPGILVRVGRIATQRSLRHLGQCDDHRCPAGCAGSVVTRSCLVSRARRPTRSPLPTPDRGRDLLPGRQRIKWGSANRLSALAHGLQTPGRLGSRRPEGFATWDDWRRDIGLPDSELGIGADSIIDPRGAGPRIWFHVMPDAEVVKNRVHLDIHVSGSRSDPLATRMQRVDAEAKRLTDLGAIPLPEFASGANPARHRPCGRPPGLPVGRPGE
jgi:hypothetical protein